MKFSLLRIVFFFGLLSAPRSEFASRVDAMPVPPGGTIRGRVTLANSAKDDDAVRQFLLLNHYAISKALKLEKEPDAQAPQDSPLSERVVVYLESAKLDRGSYELPAKRPVLDQRNLAFHPKVLPVLVGTTVDFPNHDALFHNVFSYSQSKEFDLGRYPKGDSRPVTFDKPGVVSIYCDIHAHMNAVVLVLRHPFFAVPDNDGDYTIADVPDGVYTMKIWFDRDSAGEKQVTVKRGETVNVDFSL
jgi:plastocyanin